ncbi:Proteasome subunit beta type-6 [Thelohanellus kitauei]|uniref:Proteasome subunit beta n=1 Tax=Thelohanellus kitauei TaxID=669202 RepID=A0A0C2JYB1_THEKT|nr:Proteasome subunit beta type-6 [Thelohanellus kitauei]
MECIADRFKDNVDFYKERVETGTTIMAVCFKGGVVLGADSRTSAGGYYVVNRVTDKITEVDEKILCCRSGSAADTQFLADVTKYHLKLLKAQTQKPNLVRSAANIFRKYCYGYRTELSAGMIVAGYDHVQGQQVYGIPSGGSMYEAPFIIGGSGSIFLYSYFDENYREGMDEESCIAFVQNAVRMAVTRDSSSGGVARLAVVTADGIRRLPPMEIVYKPMI